VEGGRATGVRLHDGSEVRAAQVLSNADPQRSLLTFVDQRHLDADFRQAVAEIDMRGSMARIHLLIDELPQYLPFDDAREGPQHHGHAVLGAATESFEQAWEAERAGRFPEHFVIEAVIQSVTDPALAPAGHHTMTLGVQQLPFELAGTTWDTVRDEWCDRVLEDLFHYAPNLRGHILDRVIITPADIERDYHLTGGNIFQGAMFLDQLFSSRPLAGLADYRTPIEGYYLCGAGTHPGGGVMGANGHNAAQAALADLGIGAPRPGTSAPTARAGGLVDIAMSTKFGRRVGFELARQPALRRVVARAARTPGR